MCVYKKEVTGLYSYLMMKMVGYGNPFMPSAILMSTSLSTLIMAGTFPSIQNYGLAFIGMQGTSGCWSNSAGASNFEYRMLDQTTALNNEVTSLYFESTSGKFATCYMKQTASGATTYNPAFMEMTIGSGIITTISAYYFTASALIGTSQQCLQVKLVDATGGFYFVSKSLTT